MNFFRSILAEDSDTSDSEDVHQSADDSIPPVESPEDPSARFNSQDGTENAWNIGGLIKNFAARSESVIETYRKDLQEFGLGLKKETQIIREVTSRAVKDLPVSLEAGASAAHGVLDGVLKSTAEIISRESLIFGDDGDSDTPGANRSVSARYSWYEAQLSAVQSDLNTFCEEPDDAEEYGKWKLSFQLGEKRDEMDSLIGENGALDGIYKKVVPSEVDPETFWFRYFYRVDKLKQQERIRANLVKRAISADDEDELTWDVDEEEEEEDNNVGSKEADEHHGDSSNQVPKVDDSNDKLHHEKESSSSSTIVNDNDKNHGGNDTKAIEADENSSRDAAKYEKEEKSDEGSTEKEDEKTSYEKRVGGEDQDSDTKAEKIIKEDASVEKVKPAIKVDDQGGDDLSWDDDIEDVGIDEERKQSSARHDSRPDNRSVIGKQFTSAEDDEELSWDIEEDDDQPVKSQL